MPILITGGLGYIGSHFAIEAINHGYQVVIIDDLSNTSLCIKNQIKAITQKKVHCEILDITNMPALRQLFKRYSFDTVLHFAGLKSVEDSHLRPLDYYHVNVSGSINILTCMSEFNVNQLIFSSSATVYGTPLFLPYNETHALNPVNPYGYTKLFIETLLKDYAHANPNFSCAALRYFNPIGAHASGLLNTFPKGKPSNLLPLLLQVAQKKRPQIEIYGSDYQTKDGTAVRDYIHVVDLVKGHLKAMTYIQQKCGFHAFNLGSGMGHSVLELIQAFEKVNHLQIPFQFADRRIGDIDAYWADPTLAIQTLGWQPIYSLEQMLKDAWYASSRETEKLSENTVS